MQGSVSLVETTAVSPGLTCSGVARRVRGCGSVSGGVEDAREPLQPWRRRVGKPSWANNCTQVKAHSFWLPDNRNQWRRSVWPCAVGSGGWPAYRIRRDSVALRSSRLKGFRR